MRLLHTSDWHLGKTLNLLSRQEEQMAVLNEICEIADREAVHAVMIAGDLFDTFNPPTEAVELFYRTLKRLSRDGTRIVVAIAGNHDSPERIESPDPLARECGIVFIGSPLTKVTPFSLPTGLSVTASEKGFIEVKIPGVDAPLRIILTPYANERRMKTYLGSDDPEEQLRKVLRDSWQSINAAHCNRQGCNVLMAHLFVIAHSGDSLAEPDGEKPILDVGGAQAIYVADLPQHLQYVALGHLHRHIVMHNGDCPVVYSGSPLSYSLSEADQTKSVVMVDLNPGVPAVFRRVELQSAMKLVRKTFQSVQDAVAWLRGNPDVLVELTIQSTTYLTADDRKELASAHGGIVEIVPAIAVTEASAATEVDAASLSKSVEELFRDYFMHEMGQEPNERIMAMLREVLKDEQQ
jgi:DNA repair protein SbcD/Mre11